MARNPEGKEQPLIDELSDADIICNGIMQDTNKSLSCLSARKILRS